MTTTQDISEWFDRGVRDGAKHMLVVCDTFSHEDYPVYTRTVKEFYFKFHNPGQMQSVMEVYDLGKDKEQQLNTERVFNMPPHDDIY